jgi:hypothetical protein
MSKVLVFVGSRYLYLFIWVFVCMNTKGRLYMNICEYMHIFIYIYYIIFVCQKFLFLWEAGIFIYACLPMNGYVNSCEIIYISVYIYMYMHMYYIILACQKFLSL